MPECGYHYLQLIFISTLGIATSPYGLLAMTHPNLSSLRVRAPAPERGNPTRRFPKY